jgi:hypothetical protein
MRQASLWTRLKEKLKNANVFAPTATKFSTIKKEPRSIKVGSPKLKKQFF